MRQTALDRVGARTWEVAERAGPWAAVAALAAVAPLVFLALSSAAGHPWEVVGGGTAAPAEVALAALFLWVPPLMLPALVALGVVAVARPVPLAARVLAALAPLAAAAFALGTAAAVAPPEHRASALEFAVLGALVWGGGFTLPALPFLFPSRHLPALGVALGVVVIALAAPPAAVFATLAATSAADGGAPARALVVAAVALLLAAVFTGLAFIGAASAARRAAPPHLAPAAEARRLVDDQYARGAVAPEERAGWLAELDALEAAQSAHAEGSWRGLVLRAHGSALLPYAAANAVLAVAGAAFILGPDAACALGAGSCAGVSDYDAKYLRLGVAWLASYLVALSTALLAAGALAHHLAARAEGEAEPRGASHERAVADLRERVLETARERALAAGPGRAE